MLLLSASKILKPMQKTDEQFSVKAVKSYRISSQDLSL